MNPFIIFLAIPALVAALFAAFREKDEIALLGVAWFTGTFFPFVVEYNFSHRITYLYHMLIVMPGLYLVTTRLFSPKLLPVAAAIGWAIALVYGFGTCTRSAPCRASSAVDTRYVPNGRVAATVTRLLLAFIAGALLLPVGLALSKTGGKGLVHGGASRIAPTTPRQLGARGRRDAEEALCGGDDDRDEDEDRLRAGDRHADELPRDHHHAHLHDHEDRHDAGHRLHDHNPDRHITPLPTTVDRHTRWAR